jgi:hypothetical protein
MLRMPAPMSLNALTPEHALGGDDAEVLGHGAALDPGVVVMSIAVLLHESRWSIDLGRG